MLDFKILQELEHNNELLELLKSFEYETKTGTVKVLSDTNLQFIEPIQYKITYPSILTILEYKINEVSNKNFYIQEHNQKYNLKEVKQILIKLKSNT